MFKKQMSFRQICEEFEMSAAALHVGYMIFNKNILIKSMLSKISY